MDISIERIGGGRRRTIRAELAETFSQKMKGLMFSKPKNILFLLEPGRKFLGIHSFFVFFPFDAVYIEGRNGKRRVVEVVRQIRPFVFYLRNTKPADYLLEMTEENDLEVGDVLEWK